MPQAAGEINVYHWNHDTFVSIIRRCAAIGSRLAQRGEQVLILDLDQNKTLERWGRKAKIPGLTAPWDVELEIRELRRRLGMRPSEVG